MSLSSHIAPIYGKIRMIIEDWIRLRKQNDHLKRLPLSNFRGGLFCGIGKEISYSTKTLRGIALWRIGRCRKSDPPQA